MYVALPLSVVQTYLCSLLIVAANQKYCLTVDETEQIVHRGFAPRIPQPSKSFDCNIMFCHNLSGSGFYICGTALQLQAPSSWCALRKKWMRSQLCFVVVLGFQDETLLFATYLLSLQTDYERQSSFPLAFRLVYSGTHHVVYLRNSSWRYAKIGLGAL